MTRAASAISAMVKAADREATRILLPSGEPAPDDMLGPPGSTAMDVGDQGEMVLRAVQTFASALAGLAMPALMRARDPLKNHPWVFACAIAIAMNASQVSFEVQQETDERKQTRIDQIKKSGAGWLGAFPTRRHRTAMPRYCHERCRAQGVRIKGLEVLHDHPLTALLYRPNPTMLAGQQLWFLTFLWLALRGEAFWIMLDSSGNPVTWESDSIQEVWVVSPDLVKEVVIGNSFVGWEMSTSLGQMTTGAQGRPGASNKITLLAYELVHFKIPDPWNPLRGMNPIASLAGSVNLDMMAVAHNTAVMANGAEPGGVLVYEGRTPGEKAFKNSKDEEEFKDKWEQRHRGSANDRRVGLLSGGWKYVPVGMSPKDMDYLEQRKYTREEICAVMGVPKSILAITDGLNYATQISQDRNFWDKRLLPLLRLCEQTIDGTFLYVMPDTIVGLFDLSKVDALRAGLSDKVTTAMNLSGPALHMPPKEALELAGIDAPDYELNETCFVPRGFGTAQDVIEPPITTPPEINVPGQLPADKPKPALPAPVGDGGTAGGQAQHILREARRKKKGDDWSRIIRRVQGPYEARFRRSWRAYVAARRVEQLRKFDQVVTQHGIKSLWVMRSDFPVDAVLLDVRGMQKEIRDSFRPIYAAELNDVYDYTVDEIGGIPVFALDSPEIVAALHDREDLIAGTAPETIQRATRESIRRGIENDETVQQLRDRVARTYDISASSGKSLQVARTESAGFMNDAREAMFDAQGFDDREWTTAGDEHVRENHQVFGASGPHPAGFNFLTLVGEDGTLTYPNDPDGPAGEVINCRCVHIPA